MAALIKAIFPCLPLGTVQGRIPLPADRPLQSEKGAPPTPPAEEAYRLRCTSNAASIVAALFNAKTAGPSLDVHITSLVHETGGWSEYFANNILAALETALKAGKEMALVMKEAYDRVCEAAKVVEGFPADHPLETAVIVVTIVAIGVLIVLVPMVIELLGFAAEGPVEGEFGCDLILVRGDGGADGMIQ